MEPNQMQVQTSTPVEEVKEVEVKEEPCSMCLEHFFFSPDPLVIPVRFGKCNHIFCLKCCMAVQDSSFKKIEIYTPAKGVVPVLRKMPLCCPLCRAENKANSKACFIPPAKILDTNQTLTRLVKCPFCEIDFKNDRNLTRYINYNNRIKHIQMCIRRPYECPRCGLNIHPKDEEERTSTQRASMFARHIGSETIIDQPTADCKPKKCRFCWKKGKEYEVKKCEEMHELFIKFKKDFEKFTAEMVETSISLPIQDIFEMYKTYEDKLGDRRIPFDERKQFISPIVMIPQVRENWLHHILNPASSPVVHSPPHRRILRRDESSNINETKAQEQKIPTNQEMRDEMMRLRDEMDEPVSFTEVDEHPRQPARSNLMDERKDLIPQTDSSDDENDRRIEEIDDERKEESLARNMRPRRRLIRGSFADRDRLARSARIINNGWGDE